MTPRKDSPPSSFNPEKTAECAQYYLDVMELDKSPEGRWRALQELIRDSGAFPQRRSIFSRLLHKK